MSAAVDPGRAIAWARTPGYSVDMLANLAALPKARASAVLFPAGGLDSAEKQQRSADLTRVTVATFLDGGDLDKRARHERSVATRLRKLVDEYEVACRDRDSWLEHLRQDRLAAIRTQHPWFDHLDSILEYDFATRSGSDDDGGDSGDEAGSEGGSIIIYPEVDNDNHTHASQSTDDAMQGIEHHPPPPLALAGPANQAPGPAQPSPAHRHPIPHHLDSPNPRFPAAALRAALLQAPAHNSSPFRLGDDALCPACHARLPTDAAATEAHLRACFSDEIAAEEEPSCPVCDADLVALSEKQREAHIEECCRAGTGGAEGGVAVEAHAVFKCTDKTLPKDDAGQTAECVFCFGEYEAGESLVRLSCLCVFHEECVRPWWEEKEGRFCMIHRRANDPDTMAIG